MRTAQVDWGSHVALSRHADTGHNTLCGPKSDSAGNAECSEARKPIDMILRFVFDCLIPAVQSGRTRLTAARRTLTILTYRNKPIIVAVKIGHLVQQDDG
jgi:hypothetical protein